MIMTAFTAAITMPELNQATQSLTQADLDTCVNYFIQGDLWQLIGGGISVAFMLYFAFTKKNLPDFIKAIGAAFMNKGKK